MRMARVVMRLAMLVLALAGLAFFYVVSVPAA
jgi:hypothetical protein